MDLLHPRRKWLWWNVIDVLVCLLVLTRLCCIIGIVCGLPVGFRWSVEISWRMGLLKEQDGAVDSCPSLPAQMHTHTPAVDVIE